MMAVLRTKLPPLGFKPPPPFSPQMQTGRSQDSNRDAAAREAAESALASLERLQSRMDQARRMFRDRAATEFVIVTIPTAMAVAESRRLCVALGKEGVPVKRLVVNQKVPVDAADKYVEMRVRGGWGGRGGGLGGMGVMWM